MQSGWIMTGWMADDDKEQTDEWMDQMQRTECNFLKQEEDFRVIRLNS